MADLPRPPQPMTPERAKTLGRRWLAAAALFIPAGLVLEAAGFDEVMPLPYVFAVLCLIQGCNYMGWRDGYLARMSQERRAKAGESQ